MINVTWQPGLTIEDLERTAIEQAFRFYKGNKSATSRALGISVRTLETKLEKYGQDEQSALERADEEQFTRENFLQRQRGNKPLDRDSWFAARRNQRATDRAREVEDRRAKEDGFKDAKIPAPGDEGAESRMGTQPAPEASEEHGMPMPIRKEVQGMPSKHASGIGSGKRR